MKAVAHNLVKFNTIIMFAALLTFLLFYFMQYLIATSNDLSPKIFVTKIIDATVPEFKPVLHLEIEAPLPLPKKEIIVVDPIKTFNLGSGPVIPASIVSDPLAMGNVGLSIGMADNIMIPLIRTAANYPQRALARGIEGFVELSFTVNEMGNVEDPVVTYAEPQGIFDRSALQSIQRWKYSPAVKDEVAIPTYGVRQRIVFQMNSDNN
jgi:protein TonB